MLKFIRKRKTIISTLITTLLILNMCAPVVFADSSENISVNTTSAAPGFTVSAEGLITQEILDEINSELNFDDYALPNNISTQNFSTLNTRPNSSSNRITQELLDEINGELDLDEHIEARSAELNAQLLADLQTRLVTTSIENAVSTRSGGFIAPELSIDYVDDYFVSVSWTPAVYSGNSSQILYDIYVDDWYYDTTEYTGYGGISIGHDTEFTIYVKAYLEDNPSIYANSNTVTGQTLEADPPALKPVVFDQPVVNGANITINWHEDESSSNESAGYFAVFVMKDGEYDGIYYPNNNSYTYTGLQADAYYEFTIMSGYMYYGYLATSSESIPFYNGNSYFLTQPVITEDFVTDYFVGISWTPAISVGLNDQIEYEVYLDGWLYDTVSYTSYGGIGVGVETSYEIYVKAVVVNNTNKSITSEPISGQTLEANPPELKPIIFDEPVVNGTSITLNWHEDSNSPNPSADYMAVGVIIDDVYDSIESVSEMSYTYTDLQSDKYYKFVILSGYMYYGYIQTSSQAVPFYNGNANFLTQPVLTTSVDGLLDASWTPAIPVGSFDLVSYAIITNNNNYATTDNTVYNNINFGINALFTVQVKAYITDDSSKIILSNIEKGKQIQCAQGDYISLPFVASNIANISEQEFTLIYDPNKFDLITACSYSEIPVLSTGDIQPEDVTITLINVDSGIVSFKFNPTFPSTYWSGLVNVIVLKAKSTGTTITPVVSRIK